MFFAACEGYFDKIREHEMLLRNVALFASQRSADEFNKYWPLPGSQSETKLMTWGTKEEAHNLKEQIMKAHNIKL